MYPTAVILLQKRARQRFGSSNTHAEGARSYTHTWGNQAGTARAAPRPPARARPAVVIGEIGGDDVITEAGKAVELGRNDLSLRWGRDQDGWTSLYARAAGRWCAPVSFIVSVGEGSPGFQSMELTPDDDVFFKVLAPPLVGYARTPPTRKGSREAPLPNPEAQHQAPVGHLINVREGMG